MIVLALGITLTTQAQINNHNDKEQLSTEQQTTLKVKKMILKLDLTDTQANQVTPLIRKKVEERAQMRKKHKALKDSDKKPTADERFEKANHKLDKKIAFKKEMKQILNKEQFEKFEKMAHQRKAKHGKKGMKAKKGNECDKASCDQKK